MNCEQANPLVYERVLEGAANAELDRHLATCASCRAELADLELTQKLMRQALPEEEPPRRIAFVAEKPAAMPTYHPLRFWQWSFAGAAAFALLFAVLAVRKPAAPPAGDTYTRAEVEQIVAKQVALAVNASEQRQQAQIAAVIQSAGERMAEQYHYLESTQTQVYRQEEQNRAELHQVAAMVGGGQGGGVRQ